MAQPSDVRSGGKILPLKQWIVAGLAVFGAFFLAAIAGAVVAEKLGVWHVPGAGFLAALAVVVTAYLAAPRRRTLSACAVFAIGALVAWSMLEPAFYPESERYGALAYQSTHLPVVAACAGGIVGLIVVGLLRRFAQAGLDP